MATCHCPGAGRARGSADLPLQEKRAGRARGGQRPDAWRAEPVGRFPPSSGKSAEGLDGSGCMVCPTQPSGGGPRGTGGLPSLHPGAHLRGHNHPRRACGITRDWRAPSLAVGTGTLGPGGERPPGGTGAATAGHHPRRGRCLGLASAAGASSSGLARMAGRALAGSASALAILVGGSVELGPLRSPAATPT